MATLGLHRLLSFYYHFITTAMSQYVQSLLCSIKRFPVTSANAFLSAYFRYCNLSPCTVDLDHQTRMHFWAPNHRQFRKPNLVLIHGYGGNSRWQFVLQVAGLSRSFNLYIPDLLFFGKSYTKSTERSDAFQAKCVCEGLKRLGVERFSVYAISYGGFVGYRMAEMYEDMVEKLVIVSSGIGCTEEQKREQQRRIGRNAVDLLVPEKPDDIRTLMRLSVYKFDDRWFPDFFLREFINSMSNDYKKEKQELVEHLLAEKADPNIPILTQETLLIWGDKDNVFPLHMAYQLQRHLGPGSKLEILKDTGHAANVDSPYALNELIASFVLFGHSK